ncbi:MAG TPA: N-acetylmuramoyl-L-alanine amidase [Sediminibacterium sp.]|nr:N-acetylmuramoyl-L-alanine amidase [Sediminibacterium sp.]
MYRKLLPFLLVFGCIGWIQRASAQQDADKRPLRRIIIDPGHGGSAKEAGAFYGASGKIMEEKDVALAVGLKLRDLINKEIPDVEVIMTRTTDVFDHPVVKANKANAAKGDLFISLHCNDMPPLRHREVIGYTTKKVKRKGKTVTRKIPEYRTWYTPYPAKGTETYIWGVAKTKDKEEALLENNYVDTTQLVIPKEETNPAIRMMNSFRTQEYARRSRILAETVEDEFAKAGRVDRGAKQRDEKGIWVLQAVAMPAILVEMGFLSDPDDEQILTTSDGQESIAACIVKALRRYKYALEQQVSGVGKGK